MLSIIIITLNEEKYLPLLLEAIGNQGVKDLEIIVSDAGSSDSTVAIALEYGCRVVSGGLPAKGRNEGAKVATGEVLLFMDADNFFLPEGFLERLLGEFERRELDVASFPIYPWGNRLDKLAFTIYHGWVNLIQRFVAYATNSVLVRTSIFESTGGFDEDIKVAEDHDFAQRAAKVGNFGFIRTKPVYTSNRRFEEDGRIRTYTSYLLAALHMAVLGPVKSDIFRYRFNHFSRRSHLTYERLRHNRFLRRATWRRKKTVTDAEIEKIAV